ncbi:hypothetical protein T484DRAFT_1794612 [Baffinella frigidus]|nr:hypothetical protein T484DRAFT_1794612 [Cryptophyta sp. CCMP2293]
MAFLAIERLIAEGLLQGLPQGLLQGLAPPLQDPKLKNMPLDKAVYNYKKALGKGMLKVFAKMGALGKGMLKVFAKMGVSTLMSYKGAQVALYPPS